MRKNTPRNIVFFANPILARPSTHANVADFFGDSIRRPLWVDDVEKRRLEWAFVAWRSLTNEF
jgi:hypothetical protein